MVESPSIVTVDDGSESGDAGDEAPEGGKCLLSVILLNMFATVAKDPVRFAAFLSFMESLAVLGGGVVTSASACSGTEMVLSVLTLYLSLLQSGYRF